LNYYFELAKSVTFIDRNKKIEVISNDPNLKFIGKGRSAIVYKIRGTQKVLKVFYPKFSHTATEEGAIYQKLQGISYYPTLYEIGENYIVIDYIKGKTLFECLLKGIRISQDIINEVDRALNSAKQRGLNPSDIHLRNLILTSENRIKVIDVARFRQSKNCTQWSDLKKSFYSFYLKPFFPKRLPERILNFIAALYKKRIIRL
jgi:predicted Ser/Thr protein kinase